MIHISQTAAKEIKRLKQARQQPDNLFRLSVKRGGCSGWFYILDLDNPNPQINNHEEVESKSIPSKETLGDRIYESEGLTIIVDEQTDAQVHGLELDYSEDLMGGGFRFQNPNAISTCQCGLSFKTNNLQE